MRKINFYKTKSGKVPVETFIDKLTDKEAEKVFFVFELIEETEIVSSKHLKKLSGTNGLWEIRVQFGNNIFRFLGFFEGSKIIILNHAFTKKTQKTPKKEIVVAEARKKEYESIGKL